MNKKATNIPLMIFEIIAVVIVVSMMISVANSYAQSDKTLKLGAAEDIRMMVDTLVAVPGEGVVAYPQNVSLYSFILDSGSVTLFKKGESEALWITRTFILPEGYAAEGVLEEKEHLCLEKKAKRILLRECNSLDPTSTQKNPYPIIDSLEYEEDIEEDDPFQLLSSGKTSIQCLQEKKYGTHDDKSVELEFVKVGGKGFYVNKVMAEPLRLVAPIFERMNYEVTAGNDCRSGTLNCSNLHSSCLAIDINPSENPQCPKYADAAEWWGRVPSQEERERCRRREIITNIPREIIEEFEKNGFYWGGRFGQSKGEPKPDSMHFEYIGEDACCKRTFGALPSFTSKRGLLVDNAQPYTNDETMNTYLNTLIQTEYRPLTMKELILIIVNERHFASNRYNIEIFKEQTKNYFGQKGMRGQVWVYNSARYAQDRAHLYASGDIYNPVSKEVEVELPNTENTEVPRVTVVMYIS